MSYTGAICNSPISMSDINKILEGIKQSKGVTDDEVFASILRYMSSMNTPLGSLTQYIIDIATDEYISNEFYRSSPSLVKFLAEAGTNDEELQMQNFIMNHPEMMTCRNKECKGKLQGNCPIVTCYECGATYYVQVDGLSEIVCERCVSDYVKKCNKEKRKKRPIIYAI